MLAGQVADGWRRCGDDDEIEVGHDEGVLPAVAPGETRAVSCQLTHPPAVAVELIAPPRLGPRDERGIHPLRWYDLPAVGAAAIQIQLAKRQQLPRRQQHVVAAEIY